MDHFRLLCCIWIAVKHHRGIFGSGTPLASMFAFTSKTLKIGPEFDKELSKEEKHKPAIFPHASTHSSTFQNNKPSSWNGPKRGHGTSYRDEGKVPTITDSSFSQKGTERALMVRSAKEVNESKNMHESARNNLTTAEASFFPFFNKQHSRYLPHAVYSKDDLLVDVVFDTGNSAPTLFPQALLRFAYNVMETQNQVESVGNGELLKTTHKGSLRFFVPIDGCSTSDAHPAPGRTTIVDLEGLFLSEKDSISEILIGRRDMPLYPKFEKGCVFPMTSELLAYPDVKVGLNMDMTARWFIKLESPTGRIARIRKQGRHWTEDDQDVLEDLAELVDFELGGFEHHGTLEELLWRLHSTCGHPNMHAFKLTLKSFGINVAPKLIDSIYKACSTCSNRPEAKKTYASVIKSKADLLLASMDTTEPTVHGIGGFRYISTITDHVTGRIDAENCQSRTDSFIHLCNFLNNNPYIQVIRVDNAKELNSEKVKELLITKGVGMQNPAPGAHQSMGAVERANRTLKDKISLMMSSLGLLRRGDTWPWFTKAASEGVNMTIKPSLHPSKTPMELRHDLIQEFKKRLDPEYQAVPFTLPLFAFGDTVWFKTGLEKTVKDLERLPNGSRMGIYLATAHSGSCHVLGVQGERPNLWVVHPNVVSKAPGKYTGMMYQWVEWALQSEDKRGALQAMVNNNGSITLAETLSTPYEGTNADYIECTDSEGSDDDDPDDNGYNNKRSRQPPRKPTKTTKKQTTKTKRARRVQVDNDYFHDTKDKTMISLDTFILTQIRDAIESDSPTSEGALIFTSPLPQNNATIPLQTSNDCSKLCDNYKKDLEMSSKEAEDAGSPLRLGSFETLMVKLNGTEYVAVSKPVEGKVDILPLKNGYIDTTQLRGRIDPKHLLAKPIHGRILSCGKFIATPTVGMTRRTGSKGSFHMKYGYIAADEATPEDIESGKFDAADTKEWNSIVENNVLHRAVDRVPEGVRICRTRFRRTFKKDAHSKIIPKSRFLVCETKDDRDVETSTELPYAWLRRLTIVSGLTKGWMAATIDIKTAFLLVPLPEGDAPVYIRLPTHLPQCAMDLGYKPGAIHQLRQSLYGLKESPLLWQKYLETNLAILGYKTLFPGVFARFDSSNTITGYIIAYVDDLMALSAIPKDDLLKVAEKLKCSDLIPVDDSAQRHVGQEITFVRGSFFFDANAYIASMPDFESEIDNLGTSYMSPLVPYKNLPMFDIETVQKTYPPQHIHLMQRIAGTLGWISMCHPAVSSRHGELASLTHKPLPRAFRIAKGVLRELRKDGITPLEMVAVKNPEVRVWVDCALQNHSARRGWILQLADANWPLTDRRNLIAWTSKKDKAKHASSTSGEVDAIHQCLMDIPDHLAAVQALFGDVHFKILSDSMSGIMQIAGGGNTMKDRHRASYINEVLQSSPLPCDGISHVPGTINIADPLTKILALDYYTKEDNSCI